jgi:hypothetical protein
LFCNLRALSTIAVNKASSLFEQNEGEHRAERAGATIMTRLVRRPGIG